jgi:hypothetical protein
MTIPNDTPTRAVNIRRWALVVAPVLAGLLTVVGTIADPDPLANTSAELVEAYAASPGPLQFKVLGYHFAYTLWAASALGLVALVRRRGAWLANVAGVLAFLAISSIPGFLIGDFFDSAMGQHLGVEAGVTIGQTVSQQWGFVVMQVTGLAGLVLGLPLATAAAARARVLPWWPTAAVVAGTAAFLGFAVTLPGNVLFTLGLASLSFAIARSDRHRWSTVERDPAKRAANAVAGVA